MSEENEDFKYIVRLASTDVDGHKPAQYALTQIRGIHHMIAHAIIRHTGVEGNVKIGNLPDDDIKKLDDAIARLNEWLPAWMKNRNKDIYTGNDLHLVGTDIELTLREDINLLRKIRSYRGIRHERHLPVRGQRTRSNKRRGLTVGVQRRKG
jgi:small subunit ribosomal protein S13